MLLVENAVTVGGSGMCNLKLLSLHSSRDTVKCPGAPGEHPQAEREFWWRRLGSTAAVS